VARVFLPWCFGHSADGLCFGGIPLSGSAWPATEVRWGQDPALSQSFGRWVDTLTDLLVLGSDMRAGANTDVMLDPLGSFEVATTHTQVTA